MNKPVDLPLDAVNRVREFHDELTTIRQDLHRHPELGFEENYTAEVVARELTRLGIDTRAERLARTLTGDALESHRAAHRRLTDPAEMGSLFKVLAITSADAPPPPGFV